VKTMLDSIVSGYAGKRREALLPLLWEVQTAYGFIGAEAVHAVSHTLRVPEADIYGVIGFYSLFYSEPTGERIIRVCADPVCGVRGADALLDDLCQRFGIPLGETTADGQFTVERAPCLGLCDHAPAALINQCGQGESAVAPITSADSLVDGTVSRVAPSVIEGQLRVLLEGVQPDHAQSLADYGDYAALRKALGLSPEAVIEAVSQSGLIGRGGAAFPTGRKWQGARQSASDVRYLICNADESEPGTFKDRVLLEGCPHRLIEGIAIAAYAVGAGQGYIFVRGEYPTAYQRLQAALDEAHAAGWLGENVLGTGFSLHIELRRGAGAYICGEETALFEAIEGKRGFPRIKPPYPTVAGLFGKPTVVNNVETLCAVPDIIANGAEHFRNRGTKDSAGSKLVSVSGHVRRPGVYEILPGLPLRQLLDELCGGVEGRFQAVLMGGASGTFLMPDELDTPLTFENLRAIGGTFGSGAVMVFNDTVDMRDVLIRLAHFFQHESCGKCFPCQLGTQRQLEILERAPLLGDTQRLHDIGRTMTEASLCGLGQTAASAILSAMKKLPGVFDRETHDGHQQDNHADD